MRDIEIALLVWCLLRIKVGLNCVCVVVEVLVDLLRVLLDRAEREDAQQGTQKTAVDQGLHTCDLLLNLWEHRVRVQHRSNLFGGAVDYPTFVWGVECMVHIASIVGAAANIESRVNGLVKDRLGAVLTCAQDLVTHFPTHARLTLHGGMQGAVESAEEPLVAGPQVGLDLYAVASRYDMTQQDMT